MTTNAASDDAKAFFLSGDHLRAEAACRALLAARPDAVDALNLLGLALDAQGRGEEAAEPLRRAMAIDPARSSFPANLAVVLHKLGRNDEALQAADLATGIEPEVAGFHANRSTVLLALGRGEEALLAATQATSLNPALAVAHANRAGALLHLRRGAEALEAGRRAVELQPDLAEGHCNLAGALNALARYAEALAVARRALELRPGDIDALNNEATALIGLAREEEAVQVLRRALKIKPDFPDAELNLAIACLALGRYADGWRHFERRFETRRGLADRMLMDVAGPRWDGANPAGLRLLLHREQGLGDTLQFVRYVPLLQQRGAKVLLRVDLPLCTLLRDSFPGVPVHALGEPIGAYDAWTPFMSVPRFVPGTIAQPPHNVPYLRADPGRRAAWRQKFDRGARLNVGISWAGNAGHSNDRHRSMNLEDLAPLAAVPGVDFYSLQYGARSEQAAGDAAPFDIVHFGAQIDRAEELAALACELDLVISVDSMVAHLAGGLGAPCWVLLPLNNDWRWLRGRDDSPWYPTVRLFRQRVLGDWSAPLQEMAAALRAAAAGDRSRLTRLCQ